MVFDFAKLDCTGFPCNPNQHEVGENGFDFAKLDLHWIRLQP